MGELDKRLQGALETVRGVRNLRNGLRPNDLREMIGGVGISETNEVIKRAKKGKGLVIVRTENDPGPGITRVRPVRVK